MAALVIAPRRGGKTHALVEFMVQYPQSIMVCASQQIADMTADQFANIDVSRDRFIGPNPERLRGIYASHLIVDNAELVLSALLGRTVTLMSLTPEPLLDDQ